MQPNTLIYNRGKPRSVLKTMVLKSTWLNASLYNCLIYCVFFVASFFLFPVFDQKKTPKIQTQENVFFDFLTFTIRDLRLESNRSRRELSNHPTIIENRALGGELWSFRFLDIFSFKEKRKRNSFFRCYEENPVYVYIRIFYVYSTYIYV